MTHFEEASAIRSTVARPKVDATQISLTADEVVRLELIVEAMRRANPAIAVNDCIDTVFACGLAIPIEQYEIAAQLLEARQ